MAEQRDTDQIERQPVAASPADRRHTPPAVLVVGIVIALLLGIVIGLWVQGKIADTSSGTSSAESVDIGFAQDMSVHHGQAVEMSSLALVNATDPAIRTLAFDVVTTQQSQIGMMQGWLTLWDRPARSSGGYMEWMPMPSVSMDHSMPGMSTAQSDAEATAVSMPGMATSAELAELRALTPLIHGPV